MNYELRKGSKYEIKIKKGDGFLGKLTYVKREYLPSNGRKWETFFTEIRVEKGKILYRLRIPVKNIGTIKDGRVIADGELISEVMGVVNEKNPLDLEVDNWVEEIDIPVVESWLEGVELIKKRNFRPLPNI